MTDTTVTRDHLRTLEAADNPAADVARFILAVEGDDPPNMVDGPTEVAAD